MPVRSYVICTSPRSGSTLLCRLLDETGVAGHPDSHFHVPSLDRWLDACGLTECGFASREEALRAVVAATVERGTAGTAVFGLRMQRNSFRFFIGQLAALHPERTNDASRIEAAFGPTGFIHLTRPDKLAQAISLVKAEQSGLWHRRADGSELERLSPPAEPHYDRDAIAHHLKKLVAMDVAWEAWFSGEGIEPLRITYDTLAAAPRDVLASVLGALGLDRSLAAEVPVPTAKLADATSRVWTERYRNAASGHPGVRR